MPKYSVVKTETATVIATDETQAKEIANIEFNNYPDATYEVEQLTPAVNASLHEIRTYLISFGIYAVDVMTDDPHGFPDRMHIGLHKVEQTRHARDTYGVIDLVPCHKYVLIGNSSDNQNWDGTGWELLTCELEQVASFKNIDSLTLAGMIAYNIGRADFDLESRGHN